MITIQTFSDAHKIDLCVIPAVNFYNINVCSEPEETHMGSSSYHTEQGLSQAPCVGFSTTR